MRVSCPACDAEYDVPDRLIGSGRRLRCARCDHDWMVRPAAALPEVAAVANPSPEPMAADSVRPEAGARQGRPARGSRAPVGALGLWLAWVASVGTVVLALAGLWLFRAELSAAWPPIQRLYGLLA